MPDVFISHSSADAQFAQFLQRHLTKENVTTFLAPVSLLPGQQWPHEILQALNDSDWVLFLASRAACASPWVQQELGVALAGRKKLVPIVWDMPPSSLPGWIGHIQALNLAGASPEKLESEITGIANRIKSDKTKGLLILGLLIAGLIALGGKG